MTETVTANLTVSDLPKNVEIAEGVESIPTRLRHPTGKPMKIAGLPFFLRDGKSRVRSVV